MADDNGVVEAPAPTAPPAEPSQSGAQPQGQPSQPAAGASTPSPYSYSEDRSKWLPPDRIQRIAENYAARERAATEARYKQQIAALTGLDAPAAQRDPQADEIRKQLLQVFPELDGYTDRQKQLDEKLSLMEKFIEAQYEREGRGTLGSIDGELDKILKDMSPKAKRIFRAGFIDACQSDPEWHDRYENGDGSLVGDYAKLIRGEVFDPYQKHVTTTAATRQAAALTRNLPRGGGSATPVMRGAPAAKPGDLEAAGKRAFAMLQQHLDE